MYAALKVGTVRDLPGARVESGDGLGKIMDEEAAEARDETREAWLQRLQPLFGLLLVALSVAAVAFVYLRYGGSPRWSTQGATSGSRPRTTRRL